MPFIRAPVTTTVEVVKNQLGGVGFSHADEGSGVWILEERRESYDRLRGGIRWPGECLQAPLSASQEEIDAAKKGLSLLHRPDKGGDKEKFNDVVRAYEKIKEPLSRARRGAACVGLMKKSATAIPGAIIQLGEGQLWLGWGVPRLRVKDLHRAHRMAVDFKWHLEVQDARGRALNAADAEGAIGGWVSHHVVAVGAACWVGDPIQGYSAADEICKRVRELLEPR